MDLYLIRHAEATPAMEAGVTSDSERPLTPTGIEQGQELSDFFQREKIALTAILTSPLLRARQTAEEVVRSWPAPAPEIRICEHLAPGGKRRKIMRQLREAPGERIALVGHEPDLGRLAGWLMGSRKAQLRFAKGGVAYFQSESEPGKGTCAMVWLVTPALLRR